MAQDKYDRRTFLKKAGAGTLVAASGTTLVDGLSRYAGAQTEKERHQMLMQGTVNFKGFRAKEITPNGEFYITTYSSRVPDIDTDTFRLRIGGLVNRPYELTMKDIGGMSDTREFVTLECIGNPVGGDAIGNALWEGVTLRKVLEKAAPRKGITKVAFFAEDDYSDSIPYPMAFSGDVFLAFRMNEESLPRQHGYPLRAIVPGIYGMKNVKWLSRIELVDYNFKGYWEKKGWSDEAVIPIKSQILMPMAGKEIPIEPYVIGGVAFAGRHGIRRVQVSLDREKTWHDADLKEPLSKWSWVLWRYDWNPPKEGKYTITVRGIDKAGKVQESASLASKVLGTFPNGAKGLHSINVEVRKGANV